MLNSIEAGTTDHSTGVVNEVQATQWNSSNVPDTYTNYPVYGESGRTVDVLQNRPHVGRRQASRKSFGVNYYTYCTTLLLLLVKVPSFFG